MADPVHAAGVEPPVSSVAAVVPKRRVWPWLVALVAIAAAGAWMGWRQLTAPFPLRVLVAIDFDGHWWEGSKRSAAISDAVAERLADLGFEPVRAGDPEVMAILEESASLDEAARALRAAFVVEARVSTEIVEIPVEGGFVEVRFDAPLTLQHRDGAEERAQLHGWAAAPKKEEAMPLLARDLARQVLDAALPALMGHTSIREIFAGSDAKLVDRLAPAKNFVEARARALDGAKEAYAALERQRLAAEKAKTPPTFVSAPDADERLVWAAGRGVLVVSEPVTPVYDGAENDMLRRVGLEVLRWHGEDGPSEPLWSGYSVFTYPSTTGAAKSVVFVEDLYGHARALSVLGEKGKLRRLLIEPERKLSEPRLSPDGSMVALVDKRCRGCPAEIRVLDVGGDQARERFRLDPSDYVTLGDFRWLDATRLMVVYLPSRSQAGEPPPEEALWAIDVRSGKKSSLMVPEGGAELIDPAVSPDGKRVAVSHYNADAIATLAIEHNEVSSHPVGGRASALSFSPDGRRIVFEIDDGGDFDIAVLDLEGSRVTRVTQNDAPDRFPVFSHDGKRIYFEARNTDPVFGRKRAVSRIAWVPAPR